MANQGDQYQKVNIDQVGAGEKFLDTLNILAACTRRGVWAAFVCCVSVTERGEGSVNIDSGLGGGEGAVVLLVVLLQYCTTTARE